MILMILPIVFFILFNIALFIPTYHCPICHKRVSKHAKECPHCGIKYGKRY